MVARKTHLTSVVLKMLRICSEEEGRGLDKCSKLAQKREGGVKKRPENAHMINERSLNSIFIKEVDLVNISQ